MKSPVAIIELGRVGSLVVQRLLQREPQDLVLADSRPVTFLDAAGESIYRREDVGRPRAEVIAARLTESRGGSRLESRSGPETGPEWSSGWLRDCRLCLLTVDVTRASFALDVNRTCLAAGVPFLPCLVMGRASQIGPFVRRGVGPCLHCIDIRVRAATGRSTFTAPAHPDFDLAVRSVDALERRVAAFMQAEAGDGVGSLEGELEYLWSTDGMSRHRVIGTSRCPDCSAYQRPLPYLQRRTYQYGEDVPANPAHILTLVDQLVNPVFGPIRSLQRFEGTERDPALQHWVAELADPGWAEFGRSTLHCGGNALDEQTARAAAIGEAVERSATCPREYGQGIIATYEDVAETAVDPLLWDLYDQSTRERPGFPYCVPSRSVPMTWVWGHSLADETPVLVPASRVFSPLGAGTPGDYFDGPIISGYACGSTLEDATLGGLLETIERDAFMIAWANRLPLQRLRLDRSSGGQVGAYVDAFARASVDVRCFRLGLDLGADLVIAMARGDGVGEPAFVVAAAADVDVVAACRRALKELSANRLNVQHEMKKAGGTLPLPDPDSIIDETAHGLLYARADQQPQLDFWWNSADQVELPASSATLSAFAKIRRCVSQIKRAGLSALTVDLTSPEIRACGLWTVKVIVPGSYPMNFDSRWPHFGGARMRSAPVAAGLRETPLSIAELNRQPHPFP
jgi:ribosomal protein S12 methylthiotransferase accessory factor